MIKTKSSVKQPKTLWWLSVVYALFMVAFGGLLSSLVLYLNTGLGVPMKHAYAVFAAFMALMWTLPLLGGYVAEKFGYKNAAVVGMGVSIFGICLLSFHQMTLTYLGMAMFVIGNAMFTPSLWCLVDCCYSKEDKRRDSGFTIFYLLFNVGAVLSIFAGGIIAKLYSYNVEFALDTMFVVTGFVLLLFSLRSLQFHNSRKVDGDFQQQGKRLFVLLTLLSVIAIPFGFLLLNYVQVDKIVLYLAGVTAIVIVLRMAQKQTQKVARLKLYAFAILTTMSIAFWVVYNLEPSLLSIFSAHNVNRSMFGVTIPPSAVLGFEGFFIVAIGLMLSRLWTVLSERGKDISLVTKFSMSLFIAGLGFLWLMLGIYHEGFNHALPMLWMLGGYALFATAELLISPIGIAMVGQLSPSGKEGFLMGVWQMTAGVSAIIAGTVASLTVVPKSGSLAVTDPVFAKTFGEVGFVIVGLSIVAFLLAPKVKRLLA